MSEKIARWGRWVLWTYPLLARPFRRWAIRNLVNHKESPKAIPHLAAALASRDGRVAGSARRALGSLRAPAAVDALCALWAMDRRKDLGELITARRYQASTPIRVRVLSGLKAGKVSEFAGEGAEGVSCLVEALSDADPTIRQNADTALRSLQEPVAVDALIELVLAGIQSGYVVPILDQAKYRHSHEGRWFLYLALAGRFDEYLAEDFEFQRLRVEFHAAQPNLQARIREAILKSGDTRMNPLFVSDRREKVLADLTDQDADVLVKVNVRNRNWEDLFRYLYILPARHILRAVQAMAQAGWRPDDQDKATLLNRLLPLASDVKEAPDPVRAGMPLGAVFRAWLQEGETGPFAGKAESELRATLKESTPPAEQIAALGALQRAGKLASDDLRTASQSPHWLVRMAAAGLGASVAHLNDGGMLWFDRLAPALDAEAVWGERPCRVTRDGLEVLQEGLQRLPDKKSAGGLLLVEAVAAHYTAHDIELDLTSRVTVAEDSFEMEKGA